MEVSVLYRQCSPLAPDCEWRTLRPFRAPACGGLPSPAERRPQAHPKRLKSLLARSWQTSAGNRTARNVPERGGERGVGVGGTGQETWTWPALGQPRHRVPSSGIHHSWGRGLLKTACSSDGWPVQVAAGRVAQQLYQALLPLRPNLMSEKI